MDDLIVNHVEAHGRQGHARHDVHAAEPDGRWILVVRARDHVAEANGGQTHEAEVETVQEIAVFQFVQGESPQADIEKHNYQTEQYGGQDAQAMHRSLRFVVGTAQTVGILNVSVPHWRVQAVVRRAGPERSVRTHIERLL